LGTRPMSVAAAGVKLAERIFGKLKERSALVVGAGTVGEQVVTQLRDRGIRQLLVMNRSPERAADLAKQYGGQVVRWGDWDTALRGVDVLVSSLAVEERVFGREILERTMAARGNRALLLMDLGVPRNIDPAARDLYNVYLYSVEDLADIVEQNRGARESEVPRAEAIVDEHVSKFLSWQASVELVGLVEALRARVREERTAFVRERVASMPSMDPNERQRLENMMDDLLERLLIEPAQRLRGEKELRRKIQNLEAIRDLFLDRREKR
jgi:glutamyl-tRNA reductase